MSHRPDARLGRYGKKSKDLLVDYINDHNNRDLHPDQLEFGAPSTMNEHGLTEIMVGFSPLNGWGDEKQIMAYYRVEPSVFLKGQPVVIYVGGYTDIDIYNAIYQQYGILIEPEFAQLELITRSLPDATRNVTVNGFEAESSNGEPVPQEPVPAYLENRNYTLRFKQTHLIFFGELQIYTRRAVESLGISIDSLLDLRTYYADGNMNVPQVDLLIPKGELYVTREVFPQHYQRRAVEAMLYGMKVDNLLDVAWQLPTLLATLTKDKWVATQTPSEFNLFGAKVIYNGFVSKDQTLENAGYNFVVAIELGALCTNLTGIIKIGYQYSSSDTPGNNPYNQASVLPLFNS
jgi:hypothetical protein